MMTVRLDSDSEPNLRSDDSSVTAEFPRFTLNLKRVADHYAFIHHPSRFPRRNQNQLHGHWYGGGELIHQQHPLNKLMLHSAPFHTFDNGPTGLSGVMNPAWFSSNGTLIIADLPVEFGMNQPPADYPRFKWSFATDGRGAFSDRPFLDNGGVGDGLLTFKGNPLNLKFFIFPRMPSLPTKSSQTFWASANCRPKACSPNQHGQPGRVTKPPSIRKSC
jgi:hypothetical protein